MAEQGKPRLVILDRDGVINEDSDAYIRSPEEWIPVPGSLEAIARLHQAGYLIAVATNQSGLARGLFSDITLANIHNLMLAAVENAGGAIQAICYCPHHPQEACNCRKPQTGLLTQIEQTIDQAVKGAWLVGDSQKDLELALAGGCKPLLVRSGKGQQTEASLPAALAEQTRVFDNLAAATDYILAQDQQA